ncbi:MAG: hypothetical protein JWM77_1702 [Rhodospirillales bacterium]|jgi:hypothetical protein|nr:hypothetical protein [Rhodospirillales bacterium]
MTMSAFPFGRPGDDVGAAPILPHGVASPGVDPIFPLREAWLRAAAETAEKTRLRDRLDREALRLRPDAIAPNAPAHVAKQRARVLHDLVNARREEEAALAIEDALIEQVLQTSPETIPGIVAKLQFLVRYGAPSPETQEFPWPQLEALLRDLQRLTATEWVVFETT